MKTAREMTDRELGDAIADKWNGRNATWEDVGAFVRSLFPGHRLMTNPQPSELEQVQRDIDRTARVVQALATEKEATDSWKTESFAQGRRLLALLSRERELAGQACISAKGIAYFGHVWGDENEIEITRKVKVDSCIAHEIVELNRSGVATIASCCGHGRSRPSAIIQPSSCALAKQMGYEVARPVEAGFEIYLKTGCATPLPSDLVRK